MLLFILLVSGLDDTQVVVSHAARSDEIILIELESIDSVSDRGISSYWLVVRISWSPLIKSWVILIRPHSAALDITFDWSTVNDDSGVVDAVYNSIEDLVHVWFKSYNVESHVEDDIAGSVLDYSLEIVLWVYVIFPNVDDVAELLCALSNK